jgi:glutathione S-transferase
MKLYYMPGAGSLAAHIVLEWTGATYEAVRLDLGAVRTAEYLSLNPAGGVPLLQHGDLTLSESVAILAYVADLHPHLELLGDGRARGRAEVMRWLAFLNSDVYCSFRPIFFPKLYLPRDEFAVVLAEHARQHVRERLALVDAQLQGRDWLTGSRSIADAYLFVMLRWAMATKIGLRDFGNLLRFVRRLHGDKGVRAALALEEGLASRGPGAHSASDALRRLEGRLAGGGPVTLPAEVVGTVEYREGEGMALELRRGVVRVDVTSMDTVLSWADEKYRAEAAMPFANFSQYVRDGTIRLIF